MPEPIPIVQSWSCKYYYSFSLLLVSKISCIKNVFFEYFSLSFANIAEKIMFFAINYSHSSEFKISCFICLEVSLRGAFALDFTLKNPMVSNNN